MTIVGCDFHPGWQQVAVFDPETGEIRERKLENTHAEAERFCRALSAPVVVELDACGQTPGAPHNAVFVVWAVRHADDR